MADYMNEAILSAIDASQVKAEVSMTGNQIDANALFCVMMRPDIEQLRGAMSEQVFRFDQDLTKERGAVWDRLTTGQSVFVRFDLGFDPRAGQGQVDHVAHLRLSSTVRR